jgi:hypothetical protein
LIGNVQLGFLVIRIPIPSPLVSEIRRARAAFSMEKLDKTGSMLSTISGVNFTNLFELRTSLQGGGHSKNTLDSRREGCKCLT